MARPEQLADSSNGLTLSDVPEADLVPEEDSHLIADLYRLSKKSPKLVRSSEYKAPADSSIGIRSWKMNEFKYYDVPSPFPTLARGVFTQELKHPSGDVKYRIVARGYDKFFNIGEVPWTTWSSLEAQTTAPYVLTLKSNGCIIFIAALTPSKLLVTSKHSLGPSASASGESHAQVGERWLRKHLAEAGKTEEQLASTLWGNNWTAVAELCDDSFEEHVLPYSKDKTGLHLHGLNECTKQFKTMLQDTVDTFAKEWGFIQTPSTVLKSIPEVKEFTEAVGKSGSWRGEALEGFVVRTHVVAPKDRASAKPSPYAPGSSFFFKVKFDEPYMMYRDWREVTKILLSKGPSQGNLPKSKLRRPETVVYVKWVIDEIKRDRSQFSQYLKGKGIIATRDRFLKWMEGKEGKEAVSVVSEEKVTIVQEGEKFGKTVIVPVAIPGVGKTSVAVALAHLFGFAHTQSDDVHVKKAAPVFVKNVVKLLQTHDVVIADRNNHLKQHRQALRDAVRDFNPPVRLMALNWSFDQPPSTIHRICGDRVLARGANHQTLRGDALTKSHEDVIWQFLRQAEELQDSEVDVSVEMDLEETLEEAIKRAVDACVRILGVPMPDQEKLGEALAVARGYAPKTKRPESEQEKKKKTPRYYGILAEVDLEDVLRKKLAEQGIPTKAQEFWDRLVTDKRVAQRPHVTIVHSNSLPVETPLWERCGELDVMASPPLFSFRLGHLVWNDRVMAATVVDMAVCQDEQGTDQKGLDFVQHLPADLKKVLHITVGTGTSSILPVEARGLVEMWRQGEHSAEIGAVELKDVWVNGRVKGLMS
ncbi:RNA ligase-domain-containing protein [Sparassis latifolia]|uniref:tRNA ligase n=1 Tax=Sparassis crispa TaxID=139825 RepID=A0A401H4D5_9APHY|nr:tRNA ligase 1 [Sparassis crispa]GBE89261.1 tRNA ligase 1 [Sparassis crispa]